MSWLVDTDLLSERTKPQPDPKVLKWLEENSLGIYTSSHVIGELQAGISLLAEGARKRALQAWLNRLIDAMEGRILNFNTSVATVWGRQEAEFSKKYPTQDLVKLLNEVIVPESAGSGSWRLVSCKAK